MPTWLSSANFIWSDPQIFCMDSFLTTTPGLKTIAQNMSRDILVDFF